MNYIKEFFRNFLVLSNSILMVLVVFTVFFIAVFPPEWQKNLYNVLYTIIFISSAYSLEKGRQKFLKIAIAVIVIEWISIFLNMYYLNMAMTIVMILFFAIMVARMIGQIALAKTVSPRIFLEAVNGYLLLGLAFSLIIVLVMYFSPGSFNFNDHISLSRESNSNFSSYLYLTFVTLSTLGYGDVVPTTPLARSLSIFISVSGQLYLAIIIALIVGKYSSQRQRDIADNN
jgi:voltage-gated potassium channel